MNLALIPARGGSKRIPRKNIRPFAGKPMIAHAILAAKASGLFEHIVVSTDDGEVAAVAREWGAETPFLRPAELADDHTPTVPVVADGIRRCEALGWHATYICCVYPCVPLLDPGDLQAGLVALRDSGADYCVPVAPFPSPVQRALHRRSDGRLEPLYPDHQLTRTQDLEPAYFDTGQFYWGSREAWLTNPTVHNKAVALDLPAWHSVDIDTLDDWKTAELLYMALKQHHQHSTDHPPR